MARVKSQNNEETIVLDYFGAFTGTLLDIGANDGITVSNSYELLHRGWSGCLVEPSTSAFPRLASLYASRDDVHLFQFAIGSEDGRATFYESGEHLGKGDTALLSTLSSTERERWKHLKHRLVALITRAPNSFNATTVDVRTFSTFLAQSPIKTFDFITIDAEGFDLQILSQIDLRAVGCKVLIVEYHPEHTAAFIEQARGYRLIAKNRQNLVFAVEQSASSALRPELFAIDDGVDE